jgi:ribosomal protein L29
MTKTKMSEIREKTEAELIELVNTARETVRAERFKDKFSRKASVITGAKLEVARALTLLSARRNNKDAK